MAMMDIHILLCIALGASVTLYTALHGMRKFCPIVCVLLEPRCGIARVCCNVSLIVVSDGGSTSGGPLPLCFCCMSVCSRSAVQQSQPDDGSCCRFVENIWKCVHVYMCEQL
jgi:hypothetical protein